MKKMEYGGPELARIHSKNNDQKYFCHFTGFLEGINASGYIERGEVEPLLAECFEFFSRIGDGDASDIIQDFESDLLEHQSIGDAVAVRLSAIDPSCEKSTLNRFLGFCRGIACDGKITEGEAKEMLLFCRKHPSLMDVVGVRQISVCCEDALSDGIISDDESLEICEVLGQIVGACYGDTGVAQTFGVADYQEAKLGDINSDFCERIVVCTGKFRTSPRREFEDELSALGAIVAKHISSKTDFLVIGGEASRDWIEMNRGTKIRKAQELRCNGETPRFVSEAQVLQLLR